MAWTAPMTAVANTQFTASAFNTHVRDNLLETMPAKANVNGRIFVATGGNAIAQKATEENQDWTWTPSLSNTTIGNGTVTASYRLALGVVWWRMIFLLGSTSSITGTFALSLPKTCHTGAGSVIGSGYLDDASDATNRRVGVCRLSSSTATQIYYDGGEVGSAAPFAWDDDDFIAVAGTYIATTEFV